MHTLETQFPPLAQALGRLRQPRTWPYAARPAQTDAPATTAPDTTQPNLPAIATGAFAGAVGADDLAENDFLRVLPDPALTGDLPPTRPVAHPDQRAALTAFEAIALAPMNRVYWFDL